MIHEKVDAIYFFRAKGVTLRFFCYVDHIDLHKAIPRHHSHHNRSAVFRFEKIMSLDKEQQIKIFSEIFSTEKEIFYLISTMFDNLVDKSLLKRKSVLLCNPLFSKWWKSCESKYKSFISAKKLGLL